MNKFIISLLLFAAAGLSFSQEGEFKFRNDDRPLFDKIITVEQLSVLQANDDIVLLDVRLAEDLAADPKLIPGALYKNPEELPNWIKSLDKSKDVVVYCFGGKWVSQKVAHLLEESGIVVQSLEGGIETWKLTKNP
jgi:rhodanese-related sulfurtransferase